MKEPIPFRQPGKVSNPAQEALATLRAVAQMPAAKGLEERVKANLTRNLARNLAQNLAQKSAQKLPAGLPDVEAELDAGARGWMHSATLRGLSAAAIVLIVVGGGWGAARYGRRQATPQAVGMPRMAAPGEFSNSGAMRTPQTLTQPKVPKAKHEAQAAEKRSSKAKNGKRRKSKPTNAPTNKRSGNAPKDGTRARR
ncbi:MAG TPA: hypothetical protein VFU55_00085 [Terracidiphilus sp.]|nr:hypothetical protein [Terracidiphilus sp.]